MNQPKTNKKAPTAPWKIVVWLVSATLVAITAWKISTAMDKKRVAVHQQIEALKQKLQASD